MRYQINQKLFSFGDRFAIRNQFDEEVYVVEGAVFSIGNKLWLKDTSGTELVYIEQELFNFLPVYNIYMDGRVVATVRKKFTLFYSEFEVDSEQKEYRIEGDFFSHEYTVLSDDEVVARVSKEWFSLGDMYGVDIGDVEDHPLILALVIVLDQVCHENKQ